MILSDYLYYDFVYMFVRYCIEFDKITTNYYNFINSTLFSFYKINTQHDTKHVLTKTADKSNFMQSKNLN